MLSRAIQRRLPDAAAIDLPPITNDAQYRAALGELEELERRLELAEQRRNRSRAQVLGAKPGRSPLERAKDLLAGGTIPAIDPAAEQAAAGEELQILRAAIIELTAKLEAIARDLSYDQSARLQPLHNTALLGALQALDQLSEALDQAAAVRARLRAAGYGPSPVLLPQLEPEGAALLGHSSAIGMTRRGVSNGRSQTWASRTPTFDYSSERTRLEAELEDALAELPALRSTHMAAKTAAEDACWRFNSFLLRVNAATRHGADEASPALLDQLHEERRLRDIANGAAERARREVATCESRVGCARTGIEQLSKLENPPPLIPRREVVRRPAPTLDADYDPIVMPIRTPADAA